MAAVPKEMYAGTALCLEHRAFLHVRKVEIMGKENIYEKEMSDFPVSFMKEDIYRVDLMLPMTDGVCLETYIYHPPLTDPRGESGRSYPLVLTRSPYAKAFAVYEQQALEFAMRGIAFAIQFCRGTGKSQGKWVPNIYDRSDGLDTMNYLASLDWVESLGYFGGSYVAFTGWIMADAVPEKVKGMYLSVYGTDRHVSAYKDGLFRQDILTSWAMDNAGEKIDSDYLKSCSYLPQARVDRDLWQVDLPWYRDWITHTDYNDPYWQTGVWETLKNIPSKLTYPIVIEEGWYDHHLGGALVGYRNLQGRAKEQALLRVGCWNHGKKPVLQNRECDHLENAQIAPAFRFFDCVLRGSGQLQTGVELYLIGADQWIQAKEWPQNGQDQVYYLDSAAKSSDSAAASLKPSLPESEGVLSYIYNPADPVPSHGTESCFKLMHEVGSLLQPEPGCRPDVISFLSEPLEEELVIIGNPQVELYVSSDAEDTAFTMKLMEVYADGKAYNIRSGITTLAYRGHSDSRQTYTPGDVVPINIDSWDIAWKFQKGSRIRLDISSSDFPQYSVHSNYPGIWALQDKTKAARQTIYSGSAYPSRLILPLI